MMQVNQLGVERFYTSSPDDPVEGYIGADNFGSDQTLDALWGYGTLDGETFYFTGIIIDENISFPVK